MPVAPYVVPPPLSRGDPLVSIFLFCRNSEANIGRAIASVLDQSYRHLELVIQDGLSTDGTLDIIRSRDDDRIKLVSEADASPGDAMFRVLRRCRGELIGSCLSDEQLLPRAVEEAVAHFLDHPEAGALQRDVYYTDLEGNVTSVSPGAPYSLPDYLAWNYHMHFGSAFFRTAALHSVGLMGRDWAHDCAEVEFWTRLGDLYRIDYVPGIDAKYAQGHSGQLSGDPHGVARLALGCARMMREFCPESRILQNDPRMVSYCAMGNLRFATNFYTEKGQPQILAELKKDYLARFPVDDIQADPEFCERIAWSGKTAVAAGLYRQMIGENPGFAEAYFRAAALLADGGEVQEALPLWEEALRIAPDPAQHLRYLSASLRDVRATAPQLLERQRAWAERSFSPPVLPPFAASARPGPRIRVGIHAPSWAGEEIRRQVIPVLRGLDRKRFEIFCYTEEDAAEPAIGVQAAAFSTGGLSDAAFGTLLRAHRLDIAIGLSGLAPGHRWGAFAARCAPVQAAYLGHFGTTAVPNVDYLLADAATFPRDRPSFSTEAIFRLPGCLTCFAFDPAPPAGPPPSAKKGYVTFGCFEDASLLNPDLLALWAHLLAASPQARLLICNRRAHASDWHNLLRAQFERHGVARDRLLVVPRSTDAIPAALYGQIDVTLDPAPHGGTLSVASSLWHGVPVITLNGDRFSSSLGASLLAAAGLPDWVAASPQDYIAKAAAVCADPAPLTPLRSGLREMTVTHGLCDLPRFTRQFEEALEALAAPKASSPA